MIKIDTHSHTHWFEYHEYANLIELHFAPLAVRNCEGHIGVFQTESLFELILPVRAWARDLRNCVQWAAAHALRQLGPWALSLSLSLTHPGGMALIRSSQSM